MEKYFTYIRVSTARQGERGVSLQEQRDAITRYAQRFGLAVSRWFEERETAAKRGRPVFNEMLKLLKKGQAVGVIIHKIDRSARNLKDWADLGELIDSGIVVHFANESLDLKSRGGRLSADIQAVVAADFIRNLREETRKGLYGRIKQGLYPLPAPLGYLDRGKGKPKEPDQGKANLVRKAFELYATGRYTLDGLVKKMDRLGLRNRREGKVTKNRMSLILNNPFYIGLIQIRKTAETFPGIHEPLVGKSLFDQVQAVLTGRSRGRGPRHDFLFRKLLKCDGCTRTLVGELQKGHIYYRCHGNGCRLNCVREEVVEERILHALLPLRFQEQEREYLRSRLQVLKKGWVQEAKEQENTLKLRLHQIKDRLARLTDAFLDQIIQKDLFEERKTILLHERKNLEEKMSNLKAGSGKLPDRLTELFELAGSAYFLYKSAKTEEKRNMLQIVSSNRRVKGKNVEIMLEQPFHIIANRAKFSNGCPYGDVIRTQDRNKVSTNFMLDALLKKVIPIVMRRSFN